MRGEELALAMGIKERVRNCVGSRNKNRILDRGRTKCLTIKRYQDCCNLLSRKFNSVKSGHKIIGWREEERRERRKKKRNCSLLLIATVRF